MNLRSHTLTELRAAVAEGNKLYALDSAEQGEDDTLYGLDRQEIINDILFFHDLDEWPERWTLVEIPLEVAEDRFG